MCYPSLRLFCYLSNYKVNNKNPNDQCKNDFSTHQKFAAGMFSVGCGCRVTLGFELMLHAEGASNLFRVLQCRDIAMGHLQGIIVEGFILN